MAEITTRTPYGLTEKGFNLLTKVLAGKAELEITRVAIGDGYLTEGQSELTVTDLVHEIPSHVTGTAGTGPTVDIARIYDTTDDDGNPVCMMNVIVQNGDNEETSIREFIAYANDPDEGQIAYGYTNLGNSAYPFPKYGGKEHVSYDWNFSTYISSAANVTANVTLVAGVTHEEFYNHLNNTDNPHTIEFTEAEELTNIGSGEKLSVIFGKIKKAIATLISKMPNWDDAYTHAQSAHAPSNANYYTHPSSHSASMINETTDRQFVTASQKEGFHSHDNKSVLDGITSDKVSNWNGAATNAHTHSNKSVLDGITSDKVSDWNDAKNATFLNPIFISGISSGVAVTQQLNVRFLTKAIYFIAPVNVGDTFDYLAILDKNGVGYEVRFTQSQKQIEAGKGALFYVDNTVVDETIAGEPIYDGTVLAILG